MKKIALLFPGAGSQHIGMGQGLCARWPIANETFEEANDVLGFDLKSICFTGSPLQLNRIINLLPAILTTSVATFRVYMEEIGAEPHFLAGHSLGEYAALTAAEAMSFSTALRLVRRRSELAEVVRSDANATMSIVEGVPPADGVVVCKDISRPGHSVTVSCINSDDQFTLSGHESAIMQAEKALQQRGGRTTPMLGSPPFHSPLMENVAQEFAHDLEQAELRKPRWPVIANSDAEPHSTVDTTIRKLVDQLVHPVRWHDTMLRMQQQGIRIAVEIGAQSTLSQFVEHLQNVESLSFIRARDREKLQGLLQAPARSAPSTAAQRADGRLDLVRRSLGLIAASPNKNPDQEDYESRARGPLAALKNLLEAHKANHTQPTDAELNTCLQRVCDILDAKHIPFTSQARLLQKLRDIEETRVLLDNFLRARLSQQAADRPQP